MSDVVPIGWSRTTPPRRDAADLAGLGATSSINPTPATQLSIGVVQARAVLVRPSWRLPPGNHTRTNEVGARSRFKALPAAGS